MRTLWLRLRAPFAAYRWLQAGVYRGTLPVVPPSAAWGLVLNLAGIETRTGLDEVTTGIRPDAPPLCLAVGLCGDIPVAFSSLYQQLHSYPVGASGKDAASRAQGAKYWIAPVRREVLVDLDAQIGVQSQDSSLLARVVDGLEGRLDVPRYGLPFAGDNSCLFDRIDVLEAPLPARWYVRMEDYPTPRAGSARLTVGIDRLDSGRTGQVLYSPLERPAPLPPPGAWTWTPRPPTGPL